MTLIQAARSGAAWIPSFKLLHENRTAPVGGGSMDEKHYRSVDRRINHSLLVRTVATAKFCFTWQLAVHLWAAFGIQYSTDAYD